MSPRVEVLPIRLMLPGALPESDVRTVPLLRLMAATNDTRLMERLFLVTRRPENPTERLVCLAEAGYYGRILSASRSRTCAVQSIRQAEPRTDRKKRTPRGPRLHDVICQTRTLAAPEAAATASLQFSQFIVAEAAISFLGG